MISENIVKSSFVVQTLQRDLNNIYDAQLLIATKNTYFEGGELRMKVRAGKQFSDKRQAKRLIQKLQNPDFVITQSGENFNVVNYIVRELRFQDMKHLGNWRIYNRQVFGILYNNALRDIRYNITNNLHDTLGEKLDKAFQQTVKK